MGPAATRIAVPGTVLAGKLRVERLIGQGAMGIVLEATDITLRRRVAVKLVHPDHVLDVEKQRRFGREAYAVARLQSPHVTKVLEISELDDGTPYLVMELLEGRTLDVVIEQDGPAAVHVALDWILQALDAVAEAHAIGLVHRDLKPANLYLTDRKDRAPIVKVLDFGLVKDLASDAVKLTVEGSTMGSPAYMAPEQVNVDQVVDSRTDVWAIGVTLFELLTRELPFDGQSIPALLHQVLNENPIPLRARRPDAPPELEHIIQRCLAKDPAARFADAAELSRALVAVRTRLPQVTEATKTIRLPEGSALPPVYAPMDMMDVSSVRPRLMRGDPQASTAKRTAPRAASPRRVMLIAAGVTSVIGSGALYLVWALLAPPEVPAAPIPSAMPSVTAAAGSVPAEASAAPPAAPTEPPALVMSSHATITMQLPGSLPPAEVASWQSKAADLGACGKHASTCSRQLSVARSSDGKRLVYDAGPRCKIPREQSKCIDAVIRKSDLPLPEPSSPEGAAVKLTFR